MTATEIGCLARLKRGEYFTEHNGSFPVTPDTAIMGNTHRYHPSRSTVELVCRGSDGYCIVKIPDTGFYHWMLEKHLEAHQ